MCVHMYVCTYICRKCGVSHMCQAGTRIATTICKACTCVILCFHSVKVRSQLSKNDRKKFNSVLIVDVHNRDIIDRFVRDR